MYQDGLNGFTRMGKKPGIGKQIKKLLSYNFNELLMFTCFKSSWYSIKRTLNALNEMIFDSVGVSCWIFYCDTNQILGDRDLRNK